MRHARLTAFFAALVLILSLAAPALASEEPAESLANIDHGGNVCRVGSKVFLYDFSSDDRIVVIHDMEDWDGSVQSIDLDCDGVLYSFQDSIYYLNWDGPYIGRLDPDTLETEVVYQAPMALDDFWICDIVDDRLYFAEIEDPRYFAIYHIDKDGQVTKDSHVTGEAIEKLVNTLSDGAHFDFLSLCVCQDCILIPASDGSLYQLDFSLNLIKRYKYPGIEGISYCRQVGDDYYGYCVGSEDGVGQSFFRIAQDGSGYEDLTGAFVTAGADMTCPATYDYGPGCMYAAFCSGNSLVDLYRLDMETLEARLLSTFQLDPLEPSSESDLYISLYILSDSDCLLRVFYLSGDSTAWQHFTFAP